MKQQIGAMVLGVALMGGARGAWAGDPAGEGPVASALPAPEPGGPPPMAATTVAPVARTAFNSLFVELGGNAGIYSVNYDRVVDDRFSIRAGFGYLSLSATAGSGSTSASANVSMMAIPLVCNFLLGNENHKLELGAGLTFFYMSGNASSVGDTVSASGFSPVGTAVVGYRYVPHDGGFTFRAGFTPLIAPKTFFPWAGLSFGYLF